LTNLAATSLRQPLTFSDALGFDHDHLGAGLHEALHLVYGPCRIARAFRLQLAGGCRATGAKLNPDLGLRLQARLLHLLDQTEPIANRNRDEPAGDFHNVEPEILALPDIAIHGGRALAHHIFKKPSGRYQDLEPMA